MSIIKFKKGDTWVETVLYMTISLAVIGLLLVAIRPKIAQMRDNYAITQTVDSLNVFEDLVSSVKIAEGTTLQYGLQLSKGEFIIDGINDSVMWQSDSSYQYSELNRTIDVGRISARTMNVSSKGMYHVTLTLDYRPYGLNITVDGADKMKTLNAASVPYALWIKNSGKQGAGPLQIDVTLG